MQHYTLVAPCLFGLERMVKEELHDLGFTTTEGIDGRVSFTSDLGGVAKSNLWLRCAERVLIQLNSFPALSFEDLFQGVKAIDWTAFAGRESAIVVTGSSVRSGLASIPACQRIVKKAIVDQLGAAYGLQRLPETGPALQVQFFLLKDSCSILLDTSGTALHKRGYRADANAAPIRETLAAALVRLSRFRGGVAFADPLCGSGTIVIEAAMRASNMAPGLRRRFGFEEIGLVPPELLRLERQRALDEVALTKADIFAGDIDPAMRELTLHNAKLAGVERCIRAVTAPVKDFAPAQPRGTLVTNPPYGERMSERRECELLYREMGRVFGRLTGWDQYIISSHEEFEKHYGRRADKKRKLYNGMIKCDLYQYRYR